MQLDQADQELMQLVGIHEYLPEAALSRYGSGDAFLPAARDLQGLKLLEPCGPGYLRLTQTGVQLLAGEGMLCKRNTARSFCRPAVRHRVEAARLALCCHRAGITSVHDYRGLAREPSLAAATLLRYDNGTKLNASAQCTAFGHWDNTAYMFYVMSEENYGPVLTNELKTFRSLRYLFGGASGLTFSLIFAADTYEEAYAFITQPPPGEKRGNGQITYAQAYQRASCPVHLLSCDETGAMQLCFMCQPDARARLAQAALGGLWRPRIPELPDADGMLDGAPLVMAVDMNLRRVERLLEMAQTHGYTSVYVGCLSEQLSFLDAILPREGVREILNLPGLEAARALDLSHFLYTPARGPLQP